MIEFDGDDTGYLAWLNGSPQGYVVNVRRQHTIAYMVLHRSTCFHIAASAHPTGAFTARGYRKVCLTTADQLTGAAKALGREDGSYSKCCQHCAPALSREGRRLE
ncbi:hypothetical protein [Maricaulis sp.]|uniref:hypothetical protein n=1 Tax=Maricaulis sp. TaxID=1486257 RepID=UPI003A8E1CEB